MMKKLNSTDSFKKAFMTIFKNLFFTFVVVVIASGFIRGSSFELLNVAKSISFGAIAIGLLAFCVSFWAVKASIKAGEVEDEGIIFKKQINKVDDEKH